MKLKQSIRYQLADFIGPVIVYYGIVVAVHILFFLIHNCVNANVMYLGGGMSGFSMYSCSSAGCAPSTTICPCTCKTASAGRPCTPPGWRSQC